MIYDPRAGEVRGHRHIRRFVRNSQSLLAEHHATIETVASTSVGGRAVVELLAHLEDSEGQVMAWPLAVVAESPDDLSVVFRTYCSRRPIDGRRHLRAPILKSGDAYHLELYSPGLHRRAVGSFAHFPSIRHWRQDWGDAATDQRNAATSRWRAFLVALRPLLWPRTPR